MPVLPADAALAACKRPIDVALEIAEVLVEADEKAREIQLAAAVDAHAALDATRKSLEDATTLPELVGLQMRFFTGNAGKALAYWGALAGNARDAQLRIAAILGGSAPAAMPPDLLRGLYAIAPFVDKAARKAAAKAA